MRRFVLLQKSCEKINPKALLCKYAHQGLDIAWSRDPVVGSYPPVDLSHIQCAQLSIESGASIGKGSSLPAKHIIFCTGTPTAPPFPPVSQHY
jgi:hypothetical protein